MSVFSSTPSFQKYDWFREPPIRLCYIYRRSCHDKFFRDKFDELFRPTPASASNSETTQGRSRRSLCHGISLRTNPSLFDRFPIYSSFSNEILHGCWYCCLFPDHPGCRWLAMPAPWPAALHPRLAHHAPPPPHPRPLLPSLSSSVLAACEQ